MLTGMNPFAGESLQAVCNRVLSSAPLPTSHSNPSVPAALDDIVASCLTKEPQFRIQSAETLAEKLFPLARRTVTPAQTVPTPAATSSLRTRAARLLRSA